MKRGVLVFYWASNRLEEKAGYKHNEVLPEGTDLFETAKDIYEKGLNVMVYNSEENDIIFVDNKRFQQR